MNNPLWHTFVASFLVCALLLAAGCAILNSNESGARLAVQYATAKVVDGDAAKGEKVREVVAVARERVTGSPDVTIAELDIAVRKQIPWDELDTADALLADNLIAEIRAELERRVGNGLLSDKQRLQIAAVLSWIDRASYL